MLTGVHFLLTYICNFTCDHCFWYCGPESQGTFTLERLMGGLIECRKIESVEWIYFEGGEPFLFYPLMLEGIKLANDMGLTTGIVTNGYWATSEEDAALWLKPFREYHIADLSVSDDLFHYDKVENTAKIAIKAAGHLGIPAGPISMGSAERNEASDRKGGDVMFRGRAVEKLTGDLPIRHREELTRCPYEELEEPQRVHIDPFGNVHLCQGLSIGNIWHTHLTDLMKNYNPDSHPICGPLKGGGPALLAKKYNVTCGNGFVDECHFCFVLRRALMNRFPEFLTPAQVYGIL